MIPVKTNLMDGLISFFSPSAGLERVQHRASMNALQESGFLVPGSRKKSLRGWIPRKGASINEETKNINVSIRAGSRDLYYNSAMAVAVLKRLKANVIGSGVFLQCRVNRPLITEKLGWDDIAINVWERKTEFFFHTWARKKSCSWDNQFNYYQLQALAYLSKLMNGDFFFMLPHRKDNRNPISDLKIKLIEADLCSTPDSKTLQTDIIDGVRVSSDGTPISFYFSNTYPGNRDSILVKWEEVPIYDEKSGRVNVHHVFTAERIGQVRGLPYLTPVMEILKNITRLSEAQLMSALVQTFFTVFVKDQSGKAGLEPSFLDDDLVVKNQDEKNLVYELGNANIVELDDDKDITIADPKRTDTNFGPFFDSLLQQLGASLNIPFEVLKLHFSSSYTASRGALLQAYKTFKEERVNFNAEFDQVIYEEWLAEQVIRGNIQIPGFFTDPLIREAFLGTKWMGAGNGQIDPLKEAQASVMKIQNNLSTHEEEYSMDKGGDWESAVNRRYSEEELLKSKGLDKTSKVEPRPAIQETSTSDAGEENNTGN